MDTVKEDLRVIDEIIKARHRYACGLENSSVIGGIWTDSEDGTKSRAFFQSPDGQNGELFHALQVVGYSVTKYAAPYHWTAKKKTGPYVTYTEGDLYIHTNY